MPFSGLGAVGPLSAQTHLALDRVGFDQFGRATHESSLARTGCPILAVIASEDVEVCTIMADLDVVRRKATAAVRVETHVLGGSSDGVSWQPRLGRASVTG